MWPPQHNLEVYRGDTVRFQLVFWENEERDDPTDLTGVLVAAQIRPKPDAEPISEFVCTVTLPNIVDFELGPDASRMLPKKGVYDVQLTFPGGDVISPIGGKMALKPDVTIPIPVAP